MKSGYNSSHIYGFEEYNIVALYENVLEQNYEFSVPASYHNNSGNYIINKDLPVEATLVPGRNPFCMTVLFSPSLCEDHKELLAAAKKVYSHPSCKLSRSMMAEKYKKSLNPFLSDAVVIPKPDYTMFDLKNVVLFANDTARLIVMISIYEDDILEKARTIKSGDKLADVVSCSFREGWAKPLYSIPDMLNAEFMYSGELLFVPNTQSYAFDILTSRLPVDKIVFEESVQESLGNETNQLTLDSLVSIKDMLESSDKDTVSAGLKSLSMMDWVHYPNSIRFIMNEIDRHKWIYNKAINSTSVKYMIKTVCRGSARRYWPGSYDDEIYEEDYELFKQLQIHYNHIPSEKLMEYMRFLTFIGCTNNVIHPIIRKKEL